MLNVKVPYLCYKDALCEHISSRLLFSCISIYTFQSTYDSAIFSSVSLVFFGERPETMNGVGPSKPPIGRACRSFILGPFPFNCSFDGDDLIDEVACGCETSMMGFAFCDLS